MKCTEEERVVWDEVIRVAAKYIWHCNGDADNRRAVDRARARALLARRGSR